MSNIISHLEDDFVGLGLNKMEEKQNQQPTMKPKENIWIAQELAIFIIAYQNQSLKAQHAVSRFGKITVTIALGCNVKLWLKKMVCSDLMRRKWDKWFKGSN